MSSTTTSPQCVELIQKTISMLLSRSNRISEYKFRFQLYLWIKVDNCIIQKLCDALAKVRLSLYKIFEALMLNCLCKLNKLSPCLLITKRSSSFVYCLIVVGFSSAGATDQKNGEVFQRDHYRVFRANTFLVAV